MKFFYVLGLSLLLVGCDQTIEEFKEIADDKKYFICTNNNSKVNPPLESVLIVNKNKKTAEFMGLPYENLKEKNATLIIANSKTAAISLNRVTGDLFLDASGSYFFYECKETDPML